MRCDSVMTKQKSYLGKGWAFPLKINPQGGTGLSSAEQDVRQAIQIILRTELGERLYRPDFGCRLSELTFAPMNARTLFLIRLYVREALEVWEPRIELEEVRVDPDPVAGKVNIIIDYRLKKTYESDSLVYPFYLVSAAG